MQAIELEATITKSHQIHLFLPSYVTAKKAKVIVMFEDKNEWDSFFFSNQRVSDDFMAERAEQIESVRESFDA
jgi:hypothetical protein